MRFAFTIVITFTAACGDDGGGDDAGDPDAPPTGDPFAERTALIEVAEQIGTFGGSAEPASQLRIAITDSARWPFHRETGRRGECRLLQYEPASCPIICDGACTSDGCIAFPRHLDAGASLAITGTHAPITATREPTTGRYYNSDMLPVELFDAGAAITASAPGGADVAAFEASASAPPTLATSIASPTVLADADTDLTWTPEATAAPVFLTIVSANSGHGAPYNAVIECASPDDGAITIPGSFVAELGDLSGNPCLVGRECPPAVLSRYATAIVANGAVELRVASERVFYVAH